MDKEDQEYAEFDNAGEIEGSFGDGTSEAETPADKPTNRKPPREAPKKGDKTKEEADAAEEPEEDTESSDESEEEEQPKPKPKQKASERIRQLSADRRREERLRVAAEERANSLEERLLRLEGKGDKPDASGNPAPDPSDANKYPLGHLDDRYIEDKLEWVAERKATERADAVLQRQQENEQREAAERQQTALLEKVDDLSARGSEQFDDFHETVIETGVRGVWRLDQPTFEAAHDAEHGAQILYELSQDKAEAKRVAALTPYQQMKFVLDRDAAISARSKPRTKPGAGVPPQTQTRGASSSVRISPATDNLDDFEKAWAADAKGKR